MPSDFPYKKGCACGRLMQTDLFVNKRMSDVCFFGKASHPKRMQKSLSCHLYLPMSMTCQRSMNKGHMLKIFGLNEQEFTACVIMSGCFLHSSRMPRVAKRSQTT